MLLSLLILEGQRLCLQQSSSSSQPLVQHQQPIPSSGNGEIKQLRSQLKIHEAQVELASYLREVAHPHQIAIRASHRALVRRDGSSFKSASYRGVCRNGRKFQVGAPPLL